MLYANIENTSALSLLHHTFLNKCAEETARFESCTFYIQLFSRHYPPSTPLATLIPYPPFSTTLTPAPFLFNPLPPRPNSLLTSLLPIPLLLLFHFPVHLTLLQVQVLIHQALIPRAQIHQAQSELWPTVTCLSYTSTVWSSNKSHISNIKSK